MKYSTYVMLIVNELNNRGCRMSSVPVANLAVVEEGFASKRPAGDVAADIACEEASLEAEESNE